MQPCEGVDTRRRSASVDGAPELGTLPADGTDVDVETRDPTPAVTRWSRGGDALVRAVNVVVALVALVLLSPLMLLIAVLIRLDSPGPAIYRQLRIGLDRRWRGDDGGWRRTLDLGGRPFMLYKFRTMYVNAEEETGPVWCGEEDSRVTRVGRVLRRHRLDELPQLWNVVRGEMSVVGPRPERPSLVSYLRTRIDDYPLRQRVPPGITGWAQIHRDADQTIDDVRRKLEFDLEYLERRSLSFDLQVMMRTVPVMLRRDSALGESGSGGPPPESARRVG